MKIKPILAAFIVALLIPAIAIAFQSQRAQIGVTIIINATPNPLGYHQAPAAGDAIVATARLENAPPAIERAFEAQQLHFAPMSQTQIVAQAGGVQHDVKVEAEITPNPSATLLTSDAPGYAVVLNAEAGVATKFVCAYHVKVQTTVQSWVLKQGLSADFSDGVGDTWNGQDLANNSYASTPQATATPFVVYADDGGQWTTLSTSGGTQTYCVDLTVNMPIATPQGTYSSNAIYTLYY